MKKNHEFDAGHTCVFKILRIMRLSIFFTFLFISQAWSISIYSQESRLSINMNNVKVRDVLNEIEKRSEFYFFFTEKLINVDRDVNINMNNVKIDVILQCLFKNSDIKYEVIDRQIILTKNGNINSTLSYDGKTILGKVTDSSGGSLPGVSVVVKGTTNGTITDANGDYTITKVPENAILQFSFVGMKTQEISVVSKTTINVTLAEDAIGIEEVVAVGYGTQKKVNLTGAVASIGEELISNRPSTTVVQLLQGQMAGVLITDKGGLPGRNNTNIQIRGIGTMNNSSPLVIIDGIESSLDDINPNDINNLSVLKDAASSSIYGTRAANGVILIQTKRGENGAPKVTYSTRFGKQDLITCPNYLSSWDYAKYLNVAMVNEGKSPKYTEDEISKFKSGQFPDTYPNTDWFKLAYAGKGTLQEHNLSLTGGTETGRYMLSVGYLTQDGIVKRTNYDRYNIRFNLDSKVNKYINIGLNTSFSLRNISEPTNTFSGGANIGHILSQLSRIPPSTVNKYSDGTWGRHIDGNPIAFIEDGGLRSEKIGNFKTNIFIEVSILKNLKFKSNLSYIYENDKNHANVKVMKYGDGSIQGPNSVNDQNWLTETIDAESFLSYSPEIDNHKFNLFVGISKRKWSQEYDRSYRKDLLSDVLEQVNAGSLEGMVGEGTKNESRLGSYFGRANYTFKDKYLFEANLRYDGSSKFKSASRWGIFPSFSAGWRLSEEDFMKNNFINNLKLRASWGKLGNDRIDEYQYTALINSGINYPFFQTIQNGVAQTEANNPDLTWEKTSETDLGLDLDVWNQKISFSFDYYRRYTSDILVKIPVSTLFGLNAPYVNAGEMQNNGFESKLNFKSKLSNLNYNIGFNFSYNENKVIKFPNPSRGSRIQMEGYQWNAYYGYECIGYFDTIEEVQTEAKPVGSPIQPGDLKFKDQNNDGKIDGNDRVALGSDIPQITYGINLGADFKNFYLSCFVQGVGKVHQLLNGDNFWSFVNGGKISEKNLDFWTPDNQNARFPILHADQQHNAVVSSFTVINASYLRMKNIQIGYNIPKRIISRINMSDVKIYLSGENLLTLKNVKYPKDIDPEIIDGYSVPPLKTYSVGLSVSF